MTFLETVIARRSIRCYSSQKVEPEKLNYLLECARLAPSAVNFQPWIFIVVTNPEGKEKLYECYPRDWFKTPPVYIIACGDTSQSWKRKFDGKDHCDIDVSIAIEHICLAAVEKGLGTCWVCNFDAALCKKYFNIPGHIHPVAIIPIGYPSDNEITMEKNPRKLLSEIIKWEKFD